MKDYNYNIEELLKELKERKDNKHCDNCTKCDHKDKKDLLDVLLYIFDDEDDYEEENVKENIEKYNEDRPYTVEELTKILDDVMNNSKEKKVEEKIPERHTSKVKVRKVKKSHKVKVKVYDPNKYYHYVMLTFEDEENPVIFEGCRFLKDV